MILGAKAEKLLKTLWEEGYYVGGLQTGSHMMVIQHCQDLVVLVIIIEWQGKEPSEVARC